nr:dockerin type I domain-containing protein [Ruminococcus difficilis]
MILLLFSSAAQITVYSAENAAVSADRVKADPGDTVDVKISISNNPGIVSATIRVTFDNSVLTLLKVTDSDMLGSQAHKPELVSPYTLAWVNDTATSNYSDNGTIVTLTFKVSESAEKGKLYPIELSYDYNNYDIYDKDLNLIYFNVIAGGVDIYQSAVIIGDVNGDEKVDITDATLIQKAIAELIELSDVQKKAADTNTDGKVDITDATMIQKYIAELIDHLG